MSAIIQCAAGTELRLRDQFHDDTGTAADPTNPTCRHETPSGVYEDLTAPAKEDGKLGYFGVEIDTAGWAAGFHNVRIAGTVATDKLVATNYTIYIGPDAPANAVAIAALPTDADVNAACDTALADYDAPTKSEMDSAVSGLATAASIAALNDFDPDADTVAHVTLVDTTTTNTDMRGTDGANTTAPDNAGIAAIKVRTDQLTFTTPGSVDATATVDTEGLATSNELEAAKDEILAAVEDEVPVGYVRLTSAVHGELLPGSLVYAYLKTDTDEESPVVDPVEAAANGSWHMDVPVSDEYVLVGRLSTHSTVRTEVTT